MKIVNRKLLSLGLLIPLVSYTEEVEAPVVTPEVTQVTQHEARPLNPKKFSKTFLSQEATEDMDADADIEDDAEDTQDSDEVQSLQKLVVIGTKNNKL